MVTEPQHDWSAGWPSDRLAVRERICDRCRLRTRPGRHRDAGPDYSRDGVSWSPEYYRECSATGEVAA